MVELKKNSSKTVQNLSTYTGVYTVLNIIKKCELLLWLTCFRPQSWFILSSKSLFTRSFVLCEKLIIFSKYCFQFPTFILQKNTYLVFLKLILGQFHQHFGKSTKSLSFQMMLHFNFMDYSICFVWLLNILSIYNTIYYLPNNDSTFLCLQYNLFITMIPGANPIKI